LLNLLGNAIKFTLTGFVKIEVILQKQTKTHVLLQFNVIDSGIGIPDDLQDKVFDKFFRATPSYKGLYKGHGLGLHIAQSYAQLLGGRIKLRSKPGKGTTFYFELSIKIGDNTDGHVYLKETFKYSKPKKVTSNLAIDMENAPKLLLVEDNYIALLTLENMAHQAGCLFKSASDGESALILAKNEYFDFIITDVGLPGMSGIDFTVELRQYEKLQQKKHTPIIGLTAHAENKIKNECIMSGMNQAFTKPMSSETLEKIMLNYISSDKIVSSNNNPPTIKPASKKLGLDLPDSEEELFKLHDFALLDVNSALVSMGNNAELLNNILKSMVDQELPNDLSELKKAHSLGDWQFIEKLAHRMKGGLVYCGAFKLVHACQYLERYRKAGHVEHLEKLYLQLCSTVDETTEAISQWLKS
jgi:CheY-like chemotaxis protein